jgi:hypothetical protein
MKNFRQKIATKRSARRDAKGLFKIQLREGHAMSSRSITSRDYLITLLLSLFVLTALSGCGGGDSKTTGTGTVTHTYFKTTVGSVSTNSDGSTSTVKSNSNGRVTVEMVENGATTQNTYIVTGNSVAVESSKDLDATGKVTGTTTFTPALKIFPATTTTGTIETQTVAFVTPTGSGSTTCKLTVLGPEAVTTAVATYQNALKIQNTCNNGAVDSYNWFAAGAGQIQSQDLTTGTIVQLADQSTPTTTTPPATGGKVPTELVGTWGNSGQTYTFFTDGTFTFVSLYWPGGYNCMVLSKMETLKQGTFSASGTTLTTNTTSGETRKWDCYVPVDGSPNSISPMKPFTTTTTWSISGNQLTLNDGTSSGTFTYTKQ